jgi:hypothetical protein
LNLEKTSIIFKKFKTMKKIILLLIVVATSFAAYSQQEKGDRVINGNVNFTKQEDSDASATITLKFGKFFTQNLEVGFAPSIILGGGSTTTILSAYGNYNFLSADSKLIPYIGANFGVINIAVPNTDEDLVSAAYGGNAGMRYFFGEKTFFDAGFEYRAFSFESGSSSSIGLNFGLGVIIGSLK